MGDTRHRIVPALCALLCGLLVSSPSSGEDGEIQFSGSAEFLYRNVSQDGSEEKYNEDFDGLSSGARLGSVSLDWTNLGSVFADYARVDLHGLGGDPYESTILRIGRQDVYDFAFTYRKQDYLYDLFDVTDDEDGHTWSTERSLTGLDLTIHAHEKVDVVLGFDEADRRGDHLFMKDLQRDLFRLETPLDQVSKVYTVGANLRLGPVDVIFRQQLINRDLEFNNSTEGNLGLDTADTALLNFYDWRQKDRVESDITTVRVHTPIGSRLDLTVSAVGSYLGDEELESSVSVDADGVDFAAAPFAIVDGFSETEVEMDTFVGDVDLAVRILDPLTLIVQYSNLQREIDGETVRDLEGTGTTTSQDVLLDYDVDTIAGILEWQAHRTLVLRGGYQTADRDLERDGFGEPTRDEEFESDGDETVLFGAAWRPRGWLRLNADYEDGERDNPFTQVSLVETERLRLRAIVNPRTDMTIGATYSDFENTNPVFDSSSEGTYWSLAFSHQAGQRLNYTLSYAEQDIDTATPIVFDTAAFGGTDTGDTLFDVDHTQGSAQINYDFTSAWRSFLRYSMTEAEGDNVFVGDTTGVISEGLIQEEYSDVEVGLSYHFPSGLYVGGSYRDFEYDDDGNELVPYDGEIFTIRAGLTF